MLHGAGTRRPNMTAATPPQINRAARRVDERRLGCGAQGTYGSSWGSTHCRHCVTGGRPPHALWVSVHFRACLALQPPHMLRKAEARRCSPLLRAGTYAPEAGGQLCLMCPGNYTTLADGSDSCDTPVGAPPPPLLPPPVGDPVPFASRLPATPFHLYQQKLAVPITAARKV